MYAAVKSVGKATEVPFERLTNVSAYCPQVESKHESFLVADTRHCLSRLVVSYI